MIEKSASDIAKTPLAMLIHHKVTYGSQESYTRGTNSPQAPVVRAKIPSVFWKWPSLWSFFPLRLSFFCYSWKSQCLGPHLPKITSHYLPALSPTWILSAVVIDLHSLQNFSSCLHCLLCPPKNIDLSPAYPFPPGFIAQPLQWAWALTKGKIRGSH